MAEASRHDETITKDRYIYPSNSTSHPKRRSTHRFPFAKPSVDAGFYMGLSYEIANLRDSQSCSLSRNKPSTSRKMNPTRKINNVPIEVWENIFLRCLPSDSKHPSIREAPLLLGRVSREWRDNSQYINTLWTTLFAHFDLAKKPMLFRTGLRRWLSRAKPRQLTLVLKVSMPSSGVAPSIEREFNSLLSYIAHNAHRFHLLSVTDDRMGVYTGRCHTPPVPAPALWGERIIQVVNDNSPSFSNLVSFYYCRTYYLHESPLLITMGAPFQLPQCVRKLVLNPGPIDIPRPISPIPTLQQVVYLDLQGYSLTPAEFLQQLAFCPRIITGLFTIFGENDLVPVTTPVRLEQIRSLTLFPIMHEENLEFLGTHIDGLSNTLTELSIDSTVRQSPTLNSTALTPHRGEHLAALTLADLVVNAQDLIDFLIDCRALQSLDIKLPSVRDTQIVGMLERTTYEPESLGFLPILKKFAITIHMDLHHYFPSFFEDMVKSRRNVNLLRDSACLIEAVHLIHLGKGHKSEVDQLKESLADLADFVLIEDPKER